MYTFVILVIILSSTGASPNRNFSIIDNFISRGFESVDWCKLKCREEENIACTHKGQCLTPVGDCKFFNVKKQEIVDEHNKFRNKFAMGEDSRTGGVKVANMMALEWDDGLAFTAHCNLKQCPKEMAHDKCRITEKFKFAGQNLAWTSSSAQSVDCISECTGMVFRWYDEVQYLTPAQLKGLASKFESLKVGHAVGHFTQLAWATITHVGCGLYKMPVGSDITCMLACNYGPGGNMIGASMFKEGEPASACPGKGVKRNHFALGNDPNSDGLQVSDMLLVEWDEGLEFTAHCNLKNCPVQMAHDKCHITEQFSSSGQNLAWAWSSASLNCVEDASNRVLSWYDEITETTLSELKHLGLSFEMANPRIGHFTQMIWANVSHIGCALYSRIADGTSCMLACNYGPAGNIIGLPMFKEGKPASDCPNGLGPNSKYPGLCGRGNVVKISYLGLLIWFIFVVML